MKMSSNALALSVLFVRGSRGMLATRQKMLSYATKCLTLQNDALCHNHGIRYRSSFSKLRMNSVTDSSAESKSRAPFSSPKDSFDDSVTRNSDLLNDDSWSSLGLTSELVNAMKGMELTDPTPVQRMTIPTIMGTANVSFAAATGSGKTLAYLLPIMQALKAEEALYDNTQSATDVSLVNPIRRPKRPRCIILTPTRELSKQILAVIKQVSHQCKLSSVGIIGGEDYGKQRKALDRPIDILVASPGRLLKHRDAGHVYLGSVKHVVIDEVDTMLEQGFQGDVAKIIHPLLYKKIGGIPVGSPLANTAPQLVITSATMTPAVRRLLNGESKPRRGKEPLQENDGVGITLPPNMKMIEAPGLHRVVPRLRQVFVDVGSSDKLSLLIDIVSGGGSGAAMYTKDRLQDHSKQEQSLTIVFCNTVASARAAEYALAEAGLFTLSYHGELGSTDRAENLKRFRAQDDPSNILVATDIGARGLDVPEVDHVVMFDFPLNPIDYLHRAGRTARGVNQRQLNKEKSRAGSGRVTALVMKRDQVLAKAIEGAVQRGEPLDALSSRKSDYLTGAKLGNRASPSNKRFSNSSGERNRTKPKRFNKDGSKTRRSKK